MQEKALVGNEWEQPLELIFRDEPYQAIDPETFARWLYSKHDGAGPTDFSTVLGRYKATVDVSTGTEWRVGDFNLTPKGAVSPGPDRVVVVEKGDDTGLHVFTLFPQLGKMIVYDVQQPEFPVDAEEEAAAGLKILARGV
ncbi:MAG TPA: hypothetical protein VIJ68_00575 [Candidatus Saccharimonadales bacterium]